MSQSVLDALDRLIRTDPARRGLISTEPQWGPLLPGHLGRAALDLAQSGRSVGIVTGFFIPSADPPAAETDGPLGAVVLAETLRQLGMTVAVITDPFCRGAVEAVARCWPFPLDSVQSLSQIPDGSVSRFSHLVAIERVGPSEEQDRCFNMRGVCIDDWTPPLHRLFEQAQQATPRVKTIGIGDGGNEIGMGSAPWQELVRRLPPPHAEKIICRIPCDHTIVAGVSNWGGYALAAAVALLRNRIDIIRPWTCAHQFDCLERMVRDGPAVDGVTRLAEPTVDGLPFATYIQPWDAMRQLLGLPR